MYESFEKSKAYESCETAIDFQFFSPHKPKLLASKFSKILRKNVGFNSKRVDESKVPRIIPTVFPVFNEGNMMYCLRTPFEPYQEGMHTVLKATHLIEAYGFTNEQCGAKIHLRSKEFTHSTNRIKIMMSVDENQEAKVWEYDGTNRIYKSGMRAILPSDMFSVKITPKIFESWNSTLISYPKSDRLGLDFCKLGEGIVSINYVGGKNYERKPKDISRLVNQIIEAAYEASVNQEYTQIQLGVIKDEADRKKSMAESLESYESFCKNYPKIKLHVDLSDKCETLKQRYSEFRSKLSNLIIRGGVREGFLNYDSNRCRLQLKDGKVRSGIMIEKVDFVNCAIIGDISWCDVSSCNIRSSTLRNCKICDNNTIRTSKIYECDFGGNYTFVSSSIIDNREKIIHGEIRSSMINGKVSHLSTVVDCYYK